MLSIESLKRKIDELVILADDVEQLGVELIRNAPIKRTGFLVDMYKLMPLPSEIKIIQQEAISKYQRVYSAGHELIKEYIPDRMNEYSGSYNEKHKQVLECLRLSLFELTLSKDGKNETIKIFINELRTQQSLVASVLDVAEIRELGLRKVISAYIARTEIEQAEILLESGFDRAAGSIAGVALELYLKTLCDVNGILLPPRATIEPLAQALYQAKKFDITNLKHIQYLASIRNKCSHPNTIVVSEIQSLIVEVKKLVG